MLPTSWCRTLFSAAEEAGGSGPRANEAHGPLTTRLSQAGGECRTNIGSGIMSGGRFPYDCVGLSVLLLLTRRPR